jgi:ribosomal protein S18 acetylase RimI-like enzyme
LFHPDVGGPIGEYRPQLAGVMRSHTGLVLVAEVDGEIVGRITIGTSGNDAEISGFVVIERGRRRGIGTVLMDAAEEEARRRGSTRLKLTVAKNNEGALALYAARGYERIAQGVSAGLRRSDGVVVHEPEPAWEMVKPLR